jgi:hypothetical protein
MKKRVRRGVKLLTPGRRRARNFEEIESGIEVRD